MRFSNTFAGLRVCLALAVIVTGVTACGPADSEGETDAGRLPDGGVVVQPDAGVVVLPDGGVVVVLPDGGVVVVPPDGGLVGAPDAGVVVLPDGGIVVVEPDAGVVVLPDGGVLTPDAGDVEETDAGDVEGSDAGGSEGSDAGGSEASDAGGSSADAGSEDIDAGVDEPDAGGAPRTCERDEECGDGLCVEEPGGGSSCHSACAPSCPDGQICGTFGDTRACVVPRLSLCQPCSTDALCQSAGDPSARCVHVANARESYCGTGCTRDEDCAQGYACGDATTLLGETVKQCVRAAGASCGCTAWGVEHGASTVCASAVGATCAWQRRCALDAAEAPVLGACAAASSRELCDGLDNDCDSAVDEGCDDDTDGFCQADVQATEGARCRPGDCDDRQATTHPEADETAADGVDSDCDGQETCYVDADHDGRRTATRAVTTKIGCLAADGFALATAPLDCNDTSEFAYAGATEVPDDGLDSDCDGFELFEGNSLALDAPLAGAAAFDVGASGPFRVPPFGDVPMSGTVTRLGRGLPVTWCLTGTASHDFGAFSLVNVKLTVCRTATGPGTTVAIAGDAQVGATIWPVTGTVSRDAPYDLHLVTSKALTVRGDAFAIAPAGDRGDFWSTADGADWKLVGQRGTLVLGPNLTVQGAKVTLGSTGSVLTGTLPVGAGAAHLDLQLSGPYPDAGPYTLALSTAPLVAFRPFLPEQLPQGVQGVGPAGVVTGGGAAGAAAAISTGLTCAGDCCAVHPYGGCEVPPTSKCVTKARPACASNWTAECVTAIDACDLPLAEFYALRDARVSVNVDATHAWAPHLTGTPALGASFLTLPIPFIAAESTFLCADVETQACACHANADCCTEWGASCDATVAASCGGTEAVTRCHAHGIGLRAQVEDLWHPDIPAAPEGMFTLRHTLLDTVFDAKTPPAGTPFKPLDPASYDFRLNTMGDAVLCLSGTCPEDFLRTAVLGNTLLEHAATAVSVRGTIGKEEQYFIGTLPQVNLPPFWSATGAAVVLSASSLPAHGQYFDVFNTPNQPLDDFPVPDGLSIIAFAETPMPEITFTSDISRPFWAVSFRFDPVPPFALGVDGYGRFDWTFITPGENDGIDTLKLSNLHMYGQLNLFDFVKNAFKAVKAVKNGFDATAGAATKAPDSMRIGIEATVEIQPKQMESTDPVPSKVFGTASLEFLPIKGGGVIGANIWTEGHWREPFRMKDFAFQDFAFSLYLNIATRVPTLFGGQANAFWKSPSCSTWPAEEADWNVQPGCLTKAGAGLLFAPPIDYMLFADLKNVSLDLLPGMVNSLTPGFSNMLESVVREAQDPLGDGLENLAKLGIPTAWAESLLFPPAIEIPQIPKIPGFDMTLTDLHFSASFKATHRWGRSFPSGVYLGASASINDRWHAKLTGQLATTLFVIPTSVILAGDADPVEVGGLQFSSDPYRRFANLSGGDLLVPHASPQDVAAVSDEAGSAIQQTVEAMVRRDTWALGQAATLFQKGDATNGLTVRLVMLGASDVPTKESQYPDIMQPEGTRTPTFSVEGEDPNADRAWIVAEVRNGGQVRTYKSERGALPVGGWHHVAFSLRGTEAWGLVDDDVVPLLATGPEVELGQTTAPARIGAGFDAIDEFRQWRRMRTPTQLRKHARTLSFLDTQAADLLVRYAFDWDTGGVVNNSRNWPAGLHGTFTGAASTVAEIGGPLHFSWEESINLPASQTVDFEGGASLTLPLLQSPLGMRAWLHWKNATITSPVPVLGGEFYSKQMQLVDIPQIGALWLTGNGPNTLPGDFDDGLFGGVQSNPLAFNASGRFEWQPTGQGRQLLAGGALYMGCALGRTCSFEAPDGWMFDATGHLHFVLIPPSLVVVDGDVHANGAGLSLAGYVEVFGLRLSSSSILIDSKKATLHSRTSLPTFLGQELGFAEVDLSVQYQPLTVCGRGEVQANAPNGSELFSCEVGLCVEQQGVRITQMQCFDRCWADAQCENGQFCDLLGNCWNKRPDGDVCAGILLGDHECASGFCDPWATFPVNTCQPALDDGIGCLQDGQCKSGHCGNRPGRIEKRCFTPYTVGMNAECWDPLMCAIGTCWGTPGYASRCLCDSNAACDISPGFKGSVCKLGTWGVTPNSGICVGPLPRGWDCVASSECAAGLVCGSTGKCIAPDTISNQGECFADAECRLGATCFAGKCTCTADAKCEAGQFCDLVGKCWNKRPDGDVCAGILLGDHECTSGFCDPWATFPVNTCQPALDDGIGCLQDGQCRSGHCGNRPGRIEKRCFTPYTVGMNAECWDPLQCAIGTCWGTPGYASRCLCDSNAACDISPGFKGAVCKLGTWGVTPSSGICVGPLPRGWDCVASSECAAGLACGSSGKCIAQSTVPNQGECFANEECTLGQACLAGRCACSADAQCGAGNFCDLIGKCWPKKSNGETCLGGDHECATNFCDGRGTVCNTPLPDYTPCVSDNQCANGHCGQRPGGGRVCFTARSAGINAECVDPLQCAVGECWGTAGYPSRCLCVNNGECAGIPGTVCKTGSWGITPNSGLCITPTPRGASCTASNECGPGMLCASNGVCAVPTSVNNFGSCVANEECSYGQGCFHGQCRCTDSSQCVNQYGNSFCNTGDWFDGNLEGHCEGPRSPSDVGAFCENNSWCASNECSRQENLFGTTVCTGRPNWPNWHTCDIDAQCATNNCVFWLIPEVGGLPAGYYCSRN